MLIFESTEKNTPRRRQLGLRFVQLKQSKTVLIAKPSFVFVFADSLRYNLFTELHLHQTFQKGHVCVTGNSTSLHMNTPNTAQR